jgi:hypothetical protein
MSTFYSKFVAMHITTEIIKGLRYKLRMMGMPLDGPANALAGNDTVIKNSTIPTQTLQHKHKAICYHFVREAVVAKLIQIGYIPSKENLATKPLGATKLHIIMQKISY